MVVKLIFFILLTIISISLFPFYINNFYIGFELSELLQNDFKNLGISNYTFIAGTRFDKEFLSEKFGLSTILINVQLSQKHLADSNAIPFIEGDRDSLTGTLFVSRLLMDHYTFEKEFSFLKINFINSFGIGYNNWYYKNLENNDYVRYKRASIDLISRFRFTLFKHLFIDVPFIDIFLTTRREKVYIGEAYLNYPEYFGVFSWIGFGYSQSFKN
ncbi:MAG: hypothetical protein ABIN00_04835 [candidate division WOR-3 bacterium]